MNHSRTLSLQHVELRGRRPGPTAVFFGGVHGDEYEPMAALRRLRRELPCEQLQGRVVLVPVVNEPAFERVARTAEDGLDLARTFPGDPQGTLSQQIAAAATEWIRQADYFIDLHTGGTIFDIQPLCGYVLHPDPHLLDVQRRMARAFNLPVVWGSDWRLEGRSLSAARDLRVPGIYAECRGAAVCRSEGVQAYVEGSLRVLSEVGMLPPVAGESRVQVVVEDERPGAGHLQVCHPAPRGGFFEPVVQLGDEVQAGDLLGTVCDVLGDESADVRADRTGQVILLRSTPRVAQGEALAVILPADRIVWKAAP